MSELELDEWVKIIQRHIEFVVTQFSIDKDVLIQRIKGTESD